MTLMAESLRVGCALALATTVVAQGRAVTDSARTAMWRGWLAGAVSGSVDDALSCYRRMTDDAGPVPDRVLVLMRTHELLLLRGRTDEAKQVERQLSTLTGDTTLDWLPSPPSAADALRDALRSGDPSTIEARRAELIEELSHSGPPRPRGRPSGDEPSNDADAEPEARLQDPLSERVALPLDAPMSPILRRRVAELATARLEQRPSAGLMEADLVARLRRQPELEWLLVPLTALPATADAQRSAVEDALVRFGRALQSPTDRPERELVAAFLAAARTALAAGETERAAVLLLRDLPYRAPSP